MGAPLLYGVRLKRALDRGVVPHMGIPRPQKSAKVVLITFHVCHPNRKCDRKNSGGKAANLNDLNFGSWALLGAPALLRETGPVALEVVALTLGDHGALGRRPPFRVDVDQRRRSSAMLNGLRLRFRLSGVRASPPSLAAHSR